MKTAFLKQIRCVGCFILGVLLTKHSQADRRCCDISVSVPFQNHTHTHTHTPHAPALNAISQRFSHNAHSTSFICCPLQSLPSHHATKGATLLPAHLFQKDERVHPVNLHRRKFCSTTGSTPPPPTTTTTTTTFFHILLVPF